MTDDNFTLYFLDTEDDEDYYVLIQGKSATYEDLEQIETAIKTRREERGGNDYTTTDLEDVAVHTFQKLGYNVITNINSERIRCYT